MNFLICDYVPYNTPYAAFCQRDISREMSKKLKKQEYYIPTGIRIQENKQPGMPLF
ncbi:hypothetical protein HMPREF1548_06795 [Clostridium sp. KLE 1755]|nr:hypothetical protein HMPREF1548_06795 [Clostridium sp. KLE 1755]